MKITTTQLKALDTNSDNDNLVAGEFCEEALSEATQRAELIENICGLKLILDQDVLRQAANALAGLRHITVGTEGVAETHHGNRLGEVFSNLHSALLDLKEKAERQYHWLCMLFPTPTAQTPSSDAVRSAMSGDRQQR